MSDPCSPSLSAICYFSTAKRHRNKYSLPPFLLCKLSRCGIFHIWLPIRYFYFYLGIEDELWPNANLYLKINLLIAASMIKLGFHLN